MEDNSGFAAHKAATKGFDQPPSRSARIDSLGNHIAPSLGNQCRTTGLIRRNSHADNAEPCPKGKV